MKRSGLACCLLVGCTFGPPRGDGEGLAPDAPSTTDASAVGGDPPGPGCYGSIALTRVCLAAEPTAPLTISGTIHTGTAACLPTTMGTAAGACVLAGTSVKITSLIAIGPKPLIVLATTGEIEVIGNIDASSHVGGAAGAGAGTGTCDDGLDPSNRGGGQGGSFGARGGDGGNGSQGPLGGRAGDPIALGDVLRGGCAGAGGAGAGAGDGGAGGGAIVLIAKPRISLAASITASGAGGGAGTAAGPVLGGGGAGGGGSGGLIVLDTTNLDLSGRLSANGGGGGGAGDGDSNGKPGGDPTSEAIGAGGQKGDEGGTGGAGSSGGEGGDGTNGVGLVGGGGGGGGGGGAGVIVITDPAPLSNVSPRPQTR